MRVLFTLLQKAEGGGGDWQRQNCCSQVFICNRTLEKQERKKDCKKTKICNIAVIYYVKIENIKKKKNLICLVFCVLATCSHPYHTWYLLWQGILGRIFWNALSTPVIVQLWYLGMHYPLHPGGTFDPVDYGPKPSTSRLKKTHQRGWSKGRKGE